MVSAIAERWYSNKELDRAAKLLCDLATGKIETPDEQALDRALVIVEDFCNRHTIALASAVADLETTLALVGLSWEGTSRIKKTETIIDKLSRRQTWLTVSKMQDIAGCRATLPTQEDVSRVMDQLLALYAQRTDTPTRVRDYVTKPQASGYRAIHLYTNYDGLRVEVQLRTTLQSRWAHYTEFLTDMTGVDYKSGFGEPRVHEMLVELSHSYAGIDDKIVEGNKLVRQISSATDTVPVVFNWDSTITMLR